MADIAEILQCCEPIPESGCYVWLGKTLNGYGVLPKENGTGVRYAHREMLLSVLGDADGKHVDHVCRVKLCINPDHLRLVEPRVNAIENSDSISAVHAAKKACPKCGGAYTIIRSASRTYRRCMPCKRRYDKRWFARRASHIPPEDVTDE